MVIHELHWDGIMEFKAGWIAQKHGAEVGGLAVSWMFTSKYSWDMA